MRAHLKFPSLLNFHSLVSFHFRLILRLLAYTGLSALAATSACADDADAAADKIQYKLILSDYSASGINAKDVNLRAKFGINPSGEQAVWLAYYEERPSHFQQFRTGYERTDKWERLKLVSSLQAADYGFLGVATTAEIGGSVHGILGYGRTNLKPYDNINFDPNDNITWGAGWERKEGEDVALYRVRDNRVVKGQQIDHLLVHLPLSGLSEDSKFTVDLFSKSGTRDDEGKSINATGMALACECGKYFVRVAYDPKVNFTQSYMTRLSLGIYF